MAGEVHSASGAEGLMLGRLRWAIRNRTACAEFVRAASTDWRVLWSMARDAAEREDIAMVDACCAAVLRKNPEFWFARELPKHVRGWYSQNGQDAFIEFFFGEPRPGSRTFVEVGAFDGVHYSNVRRLQERYGWAGVCIEPVPENFRRLEESYRGTGVVCVNAAIASVEGHVEMHVSSYPHLPEWGSDVATLVGDERRRWDQFSPEWRVERVRSSPLTRVLDEIGIEQFDLLSIDAEGSDLDVLLTLDLNRFRPTLIVVEYGEDRTAIERHLGRFGYAVVHDNDQDLFLADAGATVGEGWSDPREG